MNSKRNPQAPTFAQGISGYGAYDASGALVSGWRAISSARAAAASLAKQGKGMHYAVNERTAEVIGTFEPMEIGCFEVPSIDAKFDAIRAALA
jgi:hypothetical protein